MEPLKPAHKQSILENSPNAQPGDVEEYERLLSVRFTNDPDFPSAAAPQIAEDAAKSQLSDGETRIAQLHKKLFGTRKDVSVGPAKFSER